MDFSAVSVFLVGNIPATFHAYDLRAFFSQFTEKRGFACFHFRHRPEYMNTTKPDGDSGREEEVVKEDVVDGEKKKAQSVCCVVAVKMGVEREFLKLYRGKNWSGIKGESLRSKVRLNQLKITEGTDNDSSTADLAPTISATNELTRHDLESLPEFNPPLVMPQGNVGTCLTVFMKLIRACQLPSFVIRKLRLEFPKSRSKRRYGAVPPVGFQPLREGDEDGDDGEGGGEGVEEETVYIAEQTETQHFDGSRERVRRSPSESKEAVESDDADDDLDAEEWERYEALHDDVDKQERPKERLYEEDMEVVWEKGGSGLVFYTDASHWDQMDGDFDEKCSQEDDWDVDMSLYYNYESADRYAVELRDMAKWKRLKSREEEEKTTQESVHHSSDIGSRLLKQSGWREGAGLGRTESGIAQPLEPEGQLPSCKKGLGYHGEKLETTTPTVASRKRKPRSTRDALISTVYDQPNELSDTTIRSAPPTTIKYRQQVRFIGAGLLHPSQQTQPREEELVATVGSSSNHKHSSSSRTS